MNLSDAIRLGSMLAPQIFFGVKNSEQYRKPGDILGLSERVSGTCALGAAIHAGGCRSRLDKAGPGYESFRGANAPEGALVRVTEVPWEWNRLLSAPGECPQCGRTDLVQRIIAHLNDDHRLSREAIADWVETLESPTVRARGAVFIDGQCVGEGEAKFSA